MPNYSAGIIPFALNPGDSVFLFGLVGNAAIAAVGTPGASRVSGVTTITTSAAHSFTPGQRVKIAGVSSTAFGSAGDKAFLFGFDGEYTILTVPSTTTFTYADLQKPNDTGGGGTAASIQAEQPAPPQAGQQVSIIPRRVASTAPAVAFEVTFTAAPGAFSLTIQEADTDVDSAYIVPTVAENPAGVAGYTIAAVDAGNFNARVDFSPTGGRFMRPRLVSRTNAVGLVVKATALA